MESLSHYAVNLAKLVLTKINPSIALNRLHPDATVSFSGWGEDRIVAAWLQIKGYDLTKIKYLDIGASSPTFLNNTYHFYLKGASGVLVEPDPDLVSALRSNRPRDAVLEMGITHDDKKEAELIRLSSRVFNTISAEHANRALEQSKNWRSDQRQEVVDKIKIRLATINDVIDENFRDGFPHFISIDVEGLDFKILQSLDLGKYAPVVICTEINGSLESYMELLGPHDYNLVCTTPDNYIFVKN